jgi:hypothetical protein
MSKTLLECKKYINQFPCDENGIATLLFTEENHVSNKGDDNILRILLESYTVS